MLRITVRNLLSKSIDCSDKNTKLLHILLQHTDVMHACGAKGRCTTCKVNVIAGQEGLPEDSEAERKFRQMGKLDDQERLSCQFVPAEDLEIEIPDVCKLPHLNYTY